MTDRTEYLDLEQILSLKNDFNEGSPFPHVVMDNFLPKKSAEALAVEFPNKEDERLFVYKNPLEDKLALNDWNAYPPSTYKFLQYLNSKEVIDTLSELIGVKLYPDHGLHGGGWHMHGQGGKLNPHLDYSIHPKLGLQRKLNLIIYLAEDWQSDWGGDLGFWSHDAINNKPKELLKEIKIKFNRAVLFDTTCNSWHGITKPLTPPENRSRNSIAIYYLAEPTPDASERSRALYAPTEEQEGDEEILSLIEKRADLNKSRSTYKS